MYKDILYKEKDFVFSYRVGGILIQNGKILLQKPLNDDYSIIGGHVAVLETTAQTLQREFREEIHADIEVKELLAVGEIFFPWGARPCHQISLYYRVALKDTCAIPREGSFYGFDELGDQRINLEFRWVDMAELPNLTVYPRELTSHILSGSREVYHFISDQLNK